GMFKVFYVSNGTDQSNVEELVIGDKGELNNWPSGFFDQQATDIKTIIRGDDVLSEKRKDD
ncbi:MAG: DUF3696 domain-containing protein, partial [Colwellia sp.]